MDTTLCETDNTYDGRLGLRISSIFVILVGSFFGAAFPVYASRHKGVGVPSWAFFIAKYFGSGVIVATAFIHLLAPSNEALSNPCLTGAITEYPWPEGICLMSIFSLFFVELITMRYARFGEDDHQHASAHGGHGPDVLSGPRSSLERQAQSTKQAGNPSKVNEPQDFVALEAAAETSSERRRHIPGQNHLSHANEHDNDNEANVTPSWSRAPRDEVHRVKGFDPDSHAAQLTAIFILEFGIIFHSVFIGLTLAVTGEGFTTLYVVLCFHQTFEGLALGSRLASVEWPKSRQMTPYYLGFGYALSTPIAIAVGLGVRQTFSPGSATSLITNGVFDALSAGILVYTGLVELMAHEFMFSSYMQNAPVAEVLSAFLTMCLGAGLMALLGKWA